jgi:7-keto-8-aminopelargonate synthetase-like enzyme
MLNNLPRDNKIIISELCSSFERQLAVYKELRDYVRAHLSKVILSRGDPGVLTAGGDKKMRMIERINQERAGIARHLEYWQENRAALANDRDAAVLNDILAQTEAVIKDFLTEEEKLKQYVEKICNKGGGT